MATPEDKYQTAEPRRAEAIEPGTIISPDTRREKRLPPGQTRTRKWPILQYGHVPTVSLDRWRLEIFGLVENVLRFTWSEFQALPRVSVYADFHCVTRWSRLDNVWEGVAVREIMNRAGVKPEAKFVVAHGYDSGFTTNLPLADFLAEDALFADRHDGEPLTANHGGPCRLIVPQLYAWKSAKWLRAIELVPHDRPGYWEQGGYHNHGDPWTEERFNE
jgi:DMSO/TMAO reductase YedYZ molybdopterin-dependent catalytic subunit